MVHYVLLLLLLLLLPFHGGFSRWTMISWFSLGSFCSVCFRRECLTLVEWSLWGFLMPDVLPATVLRPFFRDHPGEPVPEELFWTLWCKGRLTEADTLTIRLGVTPSALTIAHLHILYFLQTGCSSCRPTNNVKALKASLSKHWRKCKALVTTDFGLS